MSEPDTDFAIIGGGFAGVTLATMLLERDVDPSAITIFDDENPRRGSSAPAVMMHPFPGRTMRLRRGQGEYFVRSWQRLQEWRAEYDGDQWWRSAKMVRTIADDDLGEMLMESWLELKGTLPDLIECEEWEADRVNEAFAGINVSRPALVYSPAAAVILPELLRRLTEELRRRGVNLIDEKVIDFGESGGRWKVTTGSGVKYRAERVILCMGPALDALFPKLDMRRRGGEVAILDPGDVSLEGLVSAEKHIFQRPDGTWGVGSTYFDVEDIDDRCDEAALAELKAGVMDEVPGAEDAVTEQIWRGVRGAFGSDYMPLVGPVPGRTGLHIFSSFGSKGLLWAPPSAEDFAAFLTGDDEAISEHMDTRRIAAKKWTG